MALIEYGMLFDPVTGGYTVGERNKVDAAILRLRSFAPPEGYFLAFSGGKDSVVLKWLADMAGVKYKAHYHITTLDPPELVRFIRRQHADVIRDRPASNAWDLMVKKLMPPTRLCRYCCAVLKETHGKGMVTLTGVRWAESKNRREQQGMAVVQHRDKNKSLIYNEDNDAARRMVEQCFRTRTTLINPIVDWEDSDIWEFIRAERIPYCELYDEGFDRLGCIGCPMAGKKRNAQFARWPWMRGKYIQTFARIAARRRELGLPSVDDWSSGEAMFAWWMNETEADPYRVLEEAGQLALWETSGTG